MGLGRLLRIILSTAVIFAISFAPGVAEMFIGRASASISATATVVPAIGIVSPEDTLLTMSPQTQIGMTMASWGESSEESLRLDNLFLRSPSVGSVLIEVSSDDDTQGRFSGPAVRHLRFASVSADPYQPGNALLDLNEVIGSLSADCGSCTITLIYTEN
ncbi:MAG: hypothetical protein AB1483_09835 [Candidatus Zixiibacteriota bacterium]